MSWLPKQRVVVPVDFSEASREAVATALQLVSDPSEVHALHVMVPLETVSPGVMWGTVNDQTREAALRKHFEEFVKANGFEGVTLTIRTGNPGTEIADYARSINSELIVIPSHGYHGVKRVLLGSVTERVLRHASSPVLVLRRPDAD